MPQGEERSPGDPLRTHRVHIHSEDATVNNENEYLASLENDYLRKNIDHLRSTKHKQDRRISNLQKQVNSVHEQANHYQGLYEANLAALSSDSGGLEISNLHQQLNAVQLVKDALNKENLELHEQLQIANQKDSNCTKGPSCVVCMDNLVNLVCLPCRHLALCSFCGHSVDSCPICRSRIEDRMQIFMP
jgi:hypothetical protein